MGVREMPVARSGRPLGVTIIAALMVITAIFAVCGGLVKLGAAPLGFFTDGFGGVFSDAGGGIISIVLAILNLVLAFGLFGLQRWAYFATIIVVIAQVLLGVTGIGVPRIGIFGLLSNIFPIIALIYMLLDGNVRRAFRVGV